MFFGTKIRSVKSCIFRVDFYPLKIGHENCMKKCTFFGVIFSCIFKEIFLVLNFMFFTSHFFGTFLGTFLGTKFHLFLGAIFDQ